MQYPTNRLSLWLFSASHNVRVTRQFSLLITVALARCSEGDEATDVSFLIETTICLGYARPKGYRKLYEIERDLGWRDWKYEAEARARRNRLVSARGKRRRRRQRRETRQQRRRTKRRERKAEARLPLIQRDLIRATNFAGELIECCRRDWRCADYCMPV